MSFTTHTSLVTFLILGREYCSSLIYHTTISLCPQTTVLVAALAGVFLCATVKASLLTAFLSRSATSPGSDDTLHSHPDKRHHDQ